MKQLTISFWMCTFAFLSIGQENIALITPFDTDTIDTKNPLLTWSYLSGFKMNNRFHYRLILVELKDEQSAAAGILVNRPIVKMDDVPGTQYFYPYDAPELEEGHRYGWQVQKLKNGALVDQSEAWEFIIPIPEELKPSYYKMKTKNDGLICQTIEGKLYFEMEEQYSEDELTFYLYDNDNKIIDIPVTFNPDTKDETVNVKKNGANYYQIDLGSMAKVGVYKLVVKDAKNQKYQLKFAVK